MKAKRTAVRLTESAIMLAFATVLSMIKIVQMPHGGSVTAAAMLPMILVAYRYGTVWGLFTGFTASLLQMLLGLNNLSYATDAAAAVAIIAFDYIIAYTVMGLGGLFRRMKNQSVALALGALLVCALRYGCHVWSGCTVWEGVSVPTAAALVYSLGYNAVYMVPETIITVTAAALIGQMVDFSKPEIAPIARPIAQKKRSYGLFALILAGVIDAFFLFSAIQVEGGYDITGIAHADWLSIAFATVLGAVIGFSPDKVRPWLVLGTALLFDGIGVLCQADMFWMIAISAIAAVLALIVGRKLVLAAIAAPVLWDAIYLMQRLAETDPFTVEDYAALIIPPVCCAVAAVALWRRAQKSTSVEQ